VYTTSKTCGGTPFVDYSVDSGVCVPLVGKGLSIVVTCDTKVTTQFYQNEGCLGSDAPIAYTFPDNQCRDATTNPTLASIINALSIFVDCRSVQNASAIMTPSIVALFGLVTLSLLALLL